MALPNFSFEKNYWKKDFLVIGVDEVGRGALAGPVVSGAVAFLLPKLKTKFPDWETVDFSAVGINDSKKLTPRKREYLSKLIKRHSLCWGIGRSSPGMIDSKGIVWATEKSMRQAIGNAQKRLKFRLGSGGWQINPFLLVDAFHVKYVPGIGLKNQKPIIKGDEMSISIAAASIIAKVYRDDLMSKLSCSFGRWKSYRWENNKGYGTKSHKKAIGKYGISRQHRKSFCGL
jgi:ribonuclease HII